MDDQAEVIAFLSDGKSYGCAGASVQRIETHISIVFLVGEHAFKLKRAIRLSYLDYSTIALREAFCKAELALNRRTAPEMYLRVRSVVRGPDGALAFDGDGSAVDWVLEMRRFSQDDLFDNLARSRRLTPDLMRDLTDVVVRFHAIAATTPQHGGRAAVEGTLADNHGNLSKACPALDTEQTRRLYAASRTKLAAVADLLDRRRAEGKVRRCHGDLHLRNICLFQGRPTLFDCIDFSDSIACIDVQYDLAFLLMDMIHRGFRELANGVFNRYLDMTGDIEGLPALPLFMSMRAAVRAHVLAAQSRMSLSGSALEEARSYLSLAEMLLEPGTPSLLAIGGLSGVGKSTVARLLACDSPIGPGARVIRSDVIRKRLFSLQPEVRLPPSGYDADTTERVYDSVYRQAADSLKAGFTTIADATFLREHERDRIAACAERAGVAFMGVWLEAPKDVLAQRIDARRGDASDADTRVLRQQLTYDTGPIGWRRIDASQGMATILADVRRMMGPSRPGFGGHAP